MTKEELLEKIAPCSLICYTCGGYQEGVISQTARRLWKYLEGMDAFYGKHCPDKVESYQIFSEELRRLCGGKCSGCRNSGHHGCSISGCFILACTKEHGVDFCGECDAFPCGGARDLFEEEVYSQWLQGNEEIKASGVEEYWRKNREKPHYKSYCGK